MSIITPQSRIEELGLSQHADACLKKAGVFFVCDLLQKAGADLRVDCDPPAFNEIKEVLARAGLHIGEGIGG
jgi:Bacterial RNA polymerase, alpha chain C terminal domain